MNYLRSLIKLCHLLILRSYADIDINSTNKFWLVRSGAIDVFFIQKNDQDEIISRRHIFRANSGDVIFSGTLQTDKSNVSLVAAGLPGSKIWECDVDAVLELAIHYDQQHKLVKIINRWLTKLFAGVEKEKERGDCQIIEKKQGKLMPGAYISADKKAPVWLQLDITNITIKGLKVETDSLIPLVNTNWIEIEQDCNFTTYTTQELISQNKFKVILQNFYGLLLDSLTQENKEKEKNDLDILHQQVFFKKTNFLRSLGILKNVLSFRAKDRMFIVDQESSLYAACCVVAKSQGIEVIRNELYQKQKSSGTVDEIGRLSNFPVRKVNLTPGWSKKDIGSLLVFDKLGHPLALLQSSATSYELYDPVTGLSRVVTAEVEEAIDQTAFVFYQPLPSEQIDGKKILRFGFAGLGKSFISIALLGIGGGLISLLTPLATQVVFDSIIPSATYSWLIHLGIILCFAVLNIAVFNFVNNLSLLRIEGKFNVKTQTALWYRLLNLPVNFCRKFTAGNLTTRVMAINSIRQQLSGVSSNIIIGAIFSSLNFLLLFYYSSSMALIALLISVVLVIFQIVLGYVLYKYNFVIQSIEGKIFGILNQFIGGIIKLRLTNTEDKAFAIWSDKFSNQQRLFGLSLLLNNFLNTIYAIFPLLAAITIFSWFFFFSYKQLTTGEFLAFNVAFLSFQNAILRVGLVLPVIISAIPLFKRTKPILDSLPEINASRHFPGSLRGSIEVRNVSFRYNANGPDALTDISLTIQPKEFVAIVGESGSGKSTLLRLLLGFERPNLGDIYYDNKELATLNCREVRRQIGVVLQNGQLMAGTIFDNIAGAANITLDDAKEAISLAGLKEDIEQMPMGMHTFVGVGGSSLSAGQRQRLLIAQALAKKPKILMFDEATSALDNKTQAQIHSTLKGLDVTRMVIAHRLSTIIDADRIYVLHQGRIVQVGTYQQLSQAEGFFKKLITKQLLQNN
ncbi:MAG: NHLP bacteriocin export ABC transporter permease/ATPase subunit [Gammaproteobacteria bacterium]|jgi:ATP-binding cassette subfamily C protein